MENNKIMLGEYLSPRERVMRSLRNQVPDRIPLDIEARDEVWQSLRQYLNLENNDAVKDRLGIDIRHVDPLYAGPPGKQFDDGSFMDEWGFHRRMIQHEFGLYSEHVGFPLADARTVEEVEQYPWPRVKCWDVSGIAKQIDEINRNTEHCILHKAGSIFEYSWGLRGLERLLMDMVIQPEIAQAIMTHWTDFWIALNRKVLEAAEGKIDIAWTWDDIGMQSGPMISPKMWQEQIKPHHIRLNKALKEFDVKIMYHSCGGIVGFIDGFIDMGVEILNPLQPRAAGMDLAWIKATYGDRIALHGGMDIQKTLPHGTPKDVEREVRDRIRVLGAGGGYVLAAAHTIQADTPPENIVAMFDAVRSTPAPMMGSGQG